MSRPQYDHSNSALYLVSDRQGGKRAVRRPHPPPTTGPMDDDFDAYTVPATTVASNWVREETDYDTQEEPSYERTFGGAVEMTVQRMSVAPDRSNPTLSSPESRAPSEYGSKASVRSGGGFADNATWESFGHRTRESYENTGSSRRGSNGRRFKMVEHKVLEDNSERTISVWREEVSRTSIGGSSTLAAEDSISEFGQLSSGNSHAHRKWASTRKADIKPSRLKEATRESYYIPATPRSMLGITEVFSQRDHHDIPSPLKLRGVPAVMSTIASPLRSPTYIAPPTYIQAPTTVASPRRSGERPLPPPVEPRRERGNSAARSPASTVAALPRPGGQKPRRPRKPSDAASSVRATSMSSVEMILASCQPSLLHLHPMLKELGITKQEHLRALDRMGEKTRNSEIKNAALARGVTMVEWAILMDRIHDL